MKTLIVKVLCCLVLLAVIVEFFLAPKLPGSFQPIFEIGLGLQYGIIGFTYTSILTQPGHLLAGWREWIEQKYTLFHVKHYPDDIDAEARHRWILKPILTCDYCVSGQLGLWLYFVSIHYAPIGYNYPGHLAAICMAIFTGGVLSVIYQKIKA